MQNFLSISKNNSISSIAIGKFDGLHLGHQKLLQTLLDSVPKSKTKSSPKSHQNSSAQDIGIIIIDTHSNSFLTSLQDRLEQLESLATVFVLDLDKVRDLSGAKFVELLQNLLPNLHRIVVGYDFAFGKNRAFSAQDLQSLFNSNAKSQANKIEVTIIDKVCHNGVPLHSSVIKDLICYGDMIAANAMLGWKYALKGQVVRGQGLGKKRLVPTINAHINGYVLPANGVYATLTNGLKSVSFIGQRLSTDGAFALESHILEDLIKDNKLDFSDFNMLDSSEKIAQNPTIKVTFIQKIRQNRHFDTLKSLKSQITQDIAQAKQIFKNCHIKPQGFIH